MGGDLLKGPQFACFRALAVAGMEQRETVVAGGEGGGDATIHAAREQHHGDGGTGSHVPILSPR